MTEAGVKRTIARLITDEKFKTEFLASPKATAEKSGYALDENELKALANVKADDIKVAYNRAGVGNAETELEISGIKSFRNLKAKPEIQKTVVQKTVVPKATGIRKKEIK